MKLWIYTTLIIALALQPLQLQAQDDVGCGMDMPAAEMSCCDDPCKQMADCESACQAISGSGHIVAFEPASLFLNGHTRHSPAQGRAPPSAYLALPLRPPISA